MPSLFMWAAGARLRLGMPQLGEEFFHFVEFKIPLGGDVLDVIERSPGGCFADSFAPVDPHRGVESCKNVFITKKILLTFQ